MDGWMRKKSLIKFVEYSSELRLSLYNNNNTLKSGECDSGATWYVARELLSK